LGDAVRASMTLPLVFKPILKDSIPLFDGGIYDNFPVNPMKEAFQPDFIIGSSVANVKMEKPSDMDLYKLIETAIMQKTTYKVEPEDGIMMGFALENIGELDFHKARMLYEMGYETTTALMDSIKGRIERRTNLAELTEKRKKYRDSLPALIFRHIFITGVNNVQKEYIENQIHGDRLTNVTMEEFKKT
jgi:NTE family protein